MLRAPSALVFLTALITGTALAAPPRGDGGAWRSGRGEGGRGILPRGRYMSPPPRQGAPSGRAYRGPRYGGSGAPRYEARGYRGPGPSGPAYRVHRGPRYGGPVYRGPVVRGPVVRGPVYGGPVYRGPVYRGPVYRGPVYGGPVYRGPRYVGPIVRWVPPRVVVPEGPGVWVGPPPDGPALEGQSEGQLEEPAYDDGYDEDGLGDDQEGGGPDDEAWEGGSEGEGLPDAGGWDPAAPDGGAPAPDACPLNRASPTAPNAEPGDTPDGAYGEVDELTAIEDAIVDLTNRERQAQGLPALQVELRLQRAAAGHSQEMASLGYFDHSSPTAGRKSTVDRLRIEGVREFERAAENIAMGTFDPGTEAKALVRMWMDSPGHRRNILDPEVRLIGVGVAVDDKGQLIATQVFTRVAGPAQAPEDGPTAGDRNAPAEI